MVVGVIAVGSRAAKAVIGGVGMELVPGGLMKIIETMNERRGKGRLTAAGNTGYGKKIALRGIKSLELC